MSLPFTESINRYVPLFASGLFMTLFIWMCAALISCGIGLLLGIASSNRMRFIWISRCIYGYVFILRAIPAYVQVLIVYFVLPEILSINLSAPLAAIIALGFCSSAYTAEIIRSGINAIPAGQWEAAQVTGFNRLQTLQFIVLPQVMTIIVPMLANELESLLKSTAIVSTIGVVELTRTGSNIIARYFNPIPIYLAVACLYVLLSACIAGIIKLVTLKSEAYRNE